MGTRDANQIMKRVSNMRKNVRYNTQAERDRVRSALPKSTDGMSKEKRGRKTVWTDVEQKSLDEAIRSVPASAELSTAQRWDKIASKVPGRSRYLHHLYISAYIDCADIFFQLGLRHVTGRNVFGGLKNAAQYCLLRAKIKSKK